MRVRVLRFCLPLLLPMMMMMAVVGGQKGAEEPPVMRQMWMTPIQTSSLLSSLQKDFSIETLQSKVLSSYSRFQSFLEIYPEKMQKGETLSDMFYRYQQKMEQYCQEAKGKSSECEDGLHDVLRGLGRELVLPEIRRFLSEIYVNVQLPETPVMFAWVSVHSNGSSHELHHHKNSLVSAVLYLSVPAGSGDIVFHDPRGSLPPFGKTLRIPPKIGDLVLFPGWLSHEVSPTLTASPRISISLNLDGSWDTTGDVSQAFYTVPT